MDIVSHILIGKLISFFDRKTKRPGPWVMVFSFLPDLTQIPFYIFLGYLNSRPLFFPQNSDWVGARSSHPVLTAFCDIPHSFLFLFLIILPVILCFKLPKIAFFAYFLHLLIDLPTHSGEWAIRPFYPFPFAIDGLTDAWAWPFLYFLISWVLLFSLIIIIRYFLKKKNALSVNSN